MSAPPPLADLSRLYQTEFVRSVRAVGALWAVCALCSAVLQLVVLLQPAWVRSGGGGEASGTLGLFQVRHEDTPTHTRCPIRVCVGDLFLFYLTR